MLLNVHEKAKNSKKRLFAATSQGDYWTFVAVLEDDTSHQGERRNKHETRATVTLDPNTQHISVYQYR